MKAPRLSVAASGFAILVIAMNLAVIRAALFRPGPKGWGHPGGGLLPHMLADPILGPGPKGWAVFAFFLLPMIDALLIGAYRLRRRGDHTAGAAGSVITGSVATLTIFIACLISPGTAISIVTPFSRRIALVCFQGLTRLFGNSMPQTHAVEWTYAVLFAVIIPMASFCILPLLVAVIGGRVARHLRPGQPVVGVGSGESTRGVESPNDHGLESA